MAIEVQICVSGYKRSGKSAIIIQWIQGVFIKKYDPTISDSYRKLIEVDGKQVMVSMHEISDTEYPETRAILFKTCPVHIVVYAINNAKSFSEVPQLIEEIKKANKDANRAGPTFLILGNKLDLRDKREVNTEQGVEVSKMLNIPVIEVSAKDRESLSVAFEEVTRRYLDQSNNTHRKKLNKKKRRCTII